MHLVIVKNKIKSGFPFRLPSFLLLFSYNFYMVTESFAKQNFTRAAEDAVNQQIQLYQLAQQTYTAASAYFDKADVALPVRKLLHESELLLTIL